MQYHKFLELEILHSYFPNGISESFRISPLPISVRDLQNYNIQMNANKNIFTFYCGVSESENFDLTEALNGLNTLQFQLYHEDDNFKNYTSNIPLNNTHILNLKNSPGEVEIQIEQALRSENVPLETFAILILDIQELINENDPDKRLRLFLKTRELLWQYQIILRDNMKVEERDLKIYGIYNETYNGPVKKQLTQEVSALVMTSNIPLPLRQTIADNPLLKIKFTDIQTNVTKNMELKLPNQDPQSILAEQRDGVMIPALTTAIIYV
ncbi:MAG: hypothetical protein DWP94_05335 [Flavobacterium sp.]|nr:MAG: hypothetical protein DWP94_05335 [Flavobacterium sp.]